MNRFSDDMAVLRDRMEWDEPHFIVFKIQQVIVKHHLDKECSACSAAPGRMCMTVGKAPRERPVVHTERSLGGESGRTNRPRALTSS